MWWVSIFTYLILTLCSFVGLTIQICSNWYVYEHILRRAEGKRVLRWFKFCRPCSQLAHPANPGDSDTWKRADISDFPCSPCTFLSSLIIIEVWIRRTPINPIYFILGRNTKECVKVSCVIIAGKANDL